MGVNYNAANLTAESLAHLFNVTPGFSAQLVGGISETAVGFIAAQIAGAFSGGVDAPINPRTVWIEDYDNDDDQFITLTYGQTIERQIRRDSKWATVDTIQVPKQAPASSVRLLNDHPNAGNNLVYQWWLKMLQTVPPINLSSEPAAAYLQPTGREPIPGHT